MRALVIDDSRAMRTILGRILAAQGFTVSDAGNGQEALDALTALQAQGELPSLALVDWNMPVMDGLTFVKEVRSRAEYASITLMMVTTESEHGQIVRALAAGAHEYVIKPFTADAIADKLALLGLSTVNA
ncbi:two-component system chemotaxis response regulator CheY [Motilibacter rhizosphaerae]|uniref:Two-component system chemotaxis response regulator CheY n=1 Tax=Motilibacter rhizosphaerae TaxID=598652 RepID=A0A4Q7NWK1_9ACTN|nr:response regulator [Motilibacter rhizosphaerae]RZS91390.1 two-component system chemotaxis response regulator CheY [Motilibacter rhizosphaerae]